MLVHNRIWTTSNRKKICKIRRIGGLRNFGIDPREFDFNDVNGFATAKKKLSQVGNEFTLIERIKKYEKSVAETPNNHCDGAKLFKNC